MNRFEIYCIFTLDIFLEKISKIEFHFVKSVDINKEEYTFRYLENCPPGSLPTPCPHRRLLPTLTLTQTLTQEGVLQGKRVGDNFPITIPFI